MMKETLNRDLNTKSLIGEAWDLVDREDEVSVVANGEFSGLTIRELVQKYKLDLLGPKGELHDNFPLLVKIIDARERLSLQVHPNEDSCNTIGRNAEPKTEMWYILHAEEHGKICADIKKEITEKEYLSCLLNNNLEELFQFYPSKTGDGYFIPSGTVHAIGAGNLILEIQQNSDTTYRLSDWNRVDEHGDIRELHIQTGLDAINFRNSNKIKIEKPIDTTESNIVYSYVNDCPFFNIEAIYLNDDYKANTEKSKSFHLISATNSSVNIETDHSIIKLSKGETALIPYSVNNYKIVPLNCNPQEKTIVLKTTL